MPSVTKEIRAKAEVYYGQEKFEERSKFMLSEAGLPLGLLPLKDVEECGYVEETGFVWVKQKKKIQHNFAKVGRVVAYDTEVTAYVEPGRFRKLHGVKVKEFLIWLTLADIYVNDPPTGKLTAKTPQGLARTFPVAAFELEEKKEVKGLKEDLKETKEVKGLKEDIKGTEEVKGLKEGLKETKEVKGLREDIKETKEVMENTGERKDTMGVMGTKELIEFVEVKGA